MVLTVESTVRNQVMPTSGNLSGVVQTTKNNQTVLIVLQMYNPSIDINLLRCKVNSQGAVLINTFNESALTFCVWKIKVDGIGNFPISIEHATGSGVGFVTGMLSHFVLNGNIKQYAYCSNTLSNGPSSMYLPTINSKVTSQDLILGFSQATSSATASLFSNSELSFTPLFQSGGYSNGLSFYASSAKPLKIYDNLSNILAKQSGNSGRVFNLLLLLKDQSLPIINSSESDLGNKSTNFNLVFSVNEPSNYKMDIFIKLNGNVIDSVLNVSSVIDRKIEVTKELFDSLSINSLNKIEIIATNQYGDTATSTHTFTKVNAAPTAQLVEPRGDAVNVPIVDKTQPILVWNFKDTDIGDVQSAYQVVIEDINGLIVHDSTKKIGTASYYQVPINLEWTKTYKWKVTVWDKYDVPSNASEYGFFKPNRAPNLTGITPGSTDKLLPSKVGSTPVYSWTFEDLDVEAQAGYQLQIFKTADDSIVYNTNRVSKNVQTHTIPENVLLPGVEYYAILTVWDPNNLSATSGKLYIATNATPSAPTLTRPIDNFRTPIAPTLAAVIGTDPENDKQHFKIQLSQDKDFASGVVEFSSLTSRTGWKVDGFDIPLEGVDNSAAGKSVELTLQTNLEKNKTYYWRMAAIDTNTQAVGKYSTARKIRVGNRIEYDTLKRQIQTNETAARRILVALDYMLAKDGTKPSEIKVFVSNNAMDVLPTWEDATTEFLRQDYYTFTNATKTAATFGVGVKVVIEANDSMEPISINAAGITFD